MRGITAAEAEVRLIKERRNRRELEADIETLRQSARRMDEIRETVETRTSTFRENSRRDQGDWRGETGTSYNHNRSQGKTNATSYLQEMNVVIQEVNQHQTRLQTNLTTLNTTIRDLERIANGGD